MTKEKLIEFIRTYEQWKDAEGPVSPAGRHPVQLEQLSLEALVMIKVQIEIEVEKKASSNEKRV